MLIRLLDELKESATPKTVAYMCEDGGRIRLEFGGHLSIFADGCDSQLVLELDRNGRARLPGAAADDPARGWRWMDRCEQENECHRQITDDLEARLSKAQVQETSACATTP